MDSWLPRAFDVEKRGYLAWIRTPVTKTWTLPRLANDEAYEDFLRHWETIPLEQCPCRHFTVEEIQADFRIDLSSWTGTDYLKAKVLANSFTTPTLQVSIGGPRGALALFLKGAEAGAPDNPLQPLDIKQAFDQILEVVRMQCQNYKKHI